MPGAGSHCSGRRCAPISLRDPVRDRRRRTPSAPEAALFGQPRRARQRGALKRAPVPDQTAQPPQRSPTPGTTCRAATTVVHARKQHHHGEAGAGATHLARRLCFPDSMTARLRASCSDSSNLSEQWGLRPTVSCATRRGVGKTQGSRCAAPAAAPMRRVRPGLAVRADDPWANACRADYTGSTSAAGRASSTASAQPTRLIAQNTKKPAL